ncbi:MAG: DUF222 domain-containing protein [Streptosporangiales bacterium]|nr:DUF222 domain-containing protein [Streptosporangiales bacterium]
MSVPGSSLGFMGGDKTAAATADAVWERALAAREMVASLAVTDFGVLGPDDVGGVLAVVEETVRMLPGVQQGLVRQVRDRGMHADRQYKSPVPYLRDLLRITESDAAARVRAVERFQPRMTVSGEVLPPLFPRVAFAQASGVISSGHAAVIAEALQKLPAAVDQPTRVAAEQQLVATAGELDPARLRCAAKHLGAVLDPDGVLASEREQRESQEFTLTPDLHGMVRVRGRLDAPTANVVNLAVEALAKPTPSADGTPDPRTATRRRAEALGRLATMALDHAQMPTTGGHRPQVIATVTLAELEARAGVAWLNNGAPVSVHELLKTACQADTALAVFGHHGEVLHYGRSQRLAPPALRRALVARDHGCVVFGCDAPPRYTEAHHVTWWSRGGTTDIDNMALVCTVHHTAIHDGTVDLVMSNGRPHTVPPRWLDPTQKPRLNRAHARPP